MEATGAEPLKPYDPEEIGPYRLLGRLGEGGMGTVYLAIAPAGRLVAVKVVKGMFTEDDDFAVRFHHEVENARRVASFCTAQVLDNGNTADGRPYMVTEYIAGTPLSRQIAQYGALEPGPLHGVALGVAAALAAIHVAGLVHRDLKPANVILSMSGPRVIDFGIARALDASHSPTQAGELLGSPGWWSPEQVRGEEVSPWTDVFAWGCLVAYAGSGRLPYGKGDVVTLAARVLSGRPDLGSLPTPLADLAHQATSPDPFERPTAQDLLIALVGGSLPARAPTPMPMPAAMTTRVATDVLSESWQAPANVADEPDATVILSRVASAAGTQAFAPHEPTLPPVAPPAESPASGPTAGLSAEPSTGGQDPYRPAVQIAATLADSAHGRTAGEMASDTRQSAVKEKDPSQGRTASGRWLIAAGAIVLAFLVTVGVLVSRTAGERQGQPVETAALTSSPGGAADPAGAKTGAKIGADVGRAFHGDDGLRLMVPQAPRCDLGAHEGALPSRGAFCVVRWTMVNTGGDLIALSHNPELTDDQGATYAPDPASTPLPAGLKPGGRADGVLVFDLPKDRRPALLSLSDSVEVRL